MPPSIVAAYKLRKYAFVSDYLRLKILLEEGGIYLDTDVEVRKPFNDLLGSGLFLGMIFDSSIGTAVIGASRNHPVIRDMMELYVSSRFSYDENTKQFLLAFDLFNNRYFVNNNDVFTAYFIDKIQGFALNGKKQLCGQRNDIMVYPKNYFEGYSIRKSEDYTIHHCHGSWRRDDSKIEENHFSVKEVVILRAENIYSYLCRIFIIINESKSIFSHRNKIMKQLDAFAN